MKKSELRRVIAAVELAQEYAEKSQHAGELKRRVFLPLSVEFAQKAIDSLKKELESRK